MHPGAARVPGPATGAGAVIAPEVYRDFGLDLLPEVWRQRQLLGRETEFEIELRLLLLDTVGPRPHEPGWTEKREAIVSSIFTVWEAWWRH